MQELIGLLTHLLNNGKDMGYILYSVTRVKDIIDRASPEQMAIFKKLKDESGPDYYISEAIDSSGEWIYFTKRRCTKSMLIDLRSK